MAGLEGGFGAKNGTEAAEDENHTARVPHVPDSGHRREDTSDKEAHETEDGGSDARMLPFRVQGQDSGRGEDKAEENQEKQEGKFEQYPGISPYEDGRAGKAQGEKAADPGPQGFPGTWKSV